MLTIRLILPLQSLLGLFLDLTAKYIRQDIVNIVNIMNVNSLRVGLTSDVIGSSYSNGTTENVIYSFFPNVGPGYKIIEVAVNLVYLPITLFTMLAMETKLTDQNGKLLNLRGEELSIRFQIREVSELFIDIIKVHVSEGQKDKIKRAVEAGMGVNIRLSHEDLSGEHILALTKAQINKMTKAYQGG